MARDPSYDVEAAGRAEQAGFDLLEVSAGDDTVPIQFLEPPLPFIRETFPKRRAARPGVEVSGAS
jgi:hypothetical protein